MAKNRNRSDRSRRRDASPITTRSVSPVRRPSQPFVIRVPRLPLPVQDRRYFDPTVNIIDSRPSVTLSGRPARVVAALPKKRATGHPVALHEALSHVVFGSGRGSRAALVCIRRSVRRRVLAASGNLGRNRPGRKTPFSHVRC